MSAARRFIAAIEAERHRLAVADSLRGMHQLC